LLACSLGLFSTFSVDIHLVLSLTFAVSFVADLPVIAEDSVVTLDFPKALLVSGVISITLDPGVSC
jgi:hypothetical protein